MNNKGQTLALFIIILPVLMFLFICFYQIGTNKIEDKRLKESIKEAIEFGLNNLKREDVDIVIKEMIISTNKEIKEEDIEVYISDNKVNVKVLRKYSIMFIKDDNVVFDYIGKIKDDKIEIIENRGWNYEKG